MSLRPRTLLPLCLALTTLALLSFPAEAAAGAREGLTLCGRTVLPALFPFFVLSGLVVELGYGERLGRRLEHIMGPLFGLSGQGAAALVLGLIGGYPLGARTVGELYRRGQLPKWEAERLLLFCNNAGPAFLLSVVGVQLLGSPGAGWLLLGTHVAGAVLCGVAARLHPAGAPATASKPTAASPPFSTAFSAAVSSGVGSALNVCACVVLFGVLLRLLERIGVLEAGTALLAALGLPQDCAAPLFSGALEMTNGLAALPREATLPVLTAAAFVLGFGGLSVFCQTSSLLSGSGLSPIWCLRGQLLHGLLSALLTAAAAAVFPGAVSAFASSALPAGAEAVMAVLPPLFGLWAWAGVGALALGTPGRTKQ